MILSYQTLMGLILNDDLLDDFSVDQVQPASIDLRLAQDIELKPMEFKLASTVEYVKMPKSHAGKVEGKSSLARLGLFIHAAGFIDPAFEGNITLELFNCSQKTIELTENMKICQMCVEEIDVIPQKVYNECDNHYQGQTGPTESFLKEKLFKETR